MGSKRNGGRTSPKQKAFLAAFRETGNVRLACTAAKVARSGHYSWLKDAEYCKAFDLAKEDAANTLEAEAHRRAVEGWEEPVGWYKGKAGGTVRRYSDTLLIVLLKGLLPEKYRERVEVRGIIANIDYNRLPSHLLVRIRDGEHPLSVLASAGINPDDVMADKKEIKALPAGEESQ